MGKKNILLVWKRETSYYCREYRLESKNEKQYISPVLSEIIQVTIKYCILEELWKYRNRYQMSKKIEY